MPAGTYELQLRAPGAATRRLRVVLFGSTRPSAAALAEARTRNVCAAARVSGEPGPLEVGAFGEPDVTVQGGVLGATSDRDRVGSGALPTTDETASGADLGIEAFSPGRLAEEVPKSLLGTLLVAVALLLLGIAVLPRSAIPDPRLGQLLVARRVEVAAAGASLFLGVLVVIGLA